MRILIVEDEPRLLRNLAQALREVGYAVDTAETGDDGLFKAESYDYDTIVLDVMLPRLDGWEMLQRLRKKKRTPVLMLTARDAHKDRVRGLDAGADDYLVKPFAYEELLARVRALLRRGRPGDNGQALAFADLRLDPVAHEVARGDRPIDLTAQEFELLRHFLAHPRQVLTRAQLLDAVWGLPSATASNVVDVYVGYLRAKLGEPRLLHTVRGVGYVLRQT